VLPDILNSQLGLPFYFGGTGLLVVVCVMLDFVAELGARLGRSEAAT
jgi:preprotein translocase subunit SecY